MFKYVMTSQRRVKSDRRFKRRLAIRKMKDYIDWCQSNVFVRDIDGIERRLELLEAVEFIVLTTQQAVEGMKN